MEKVCPWCGQPSDRGWLKNRTESKSVVHSDTATVFKSRLQTFTTHYIQKELYYVRSVVWPTLGPTMAKEQNRTSLALVVW